MSEDDERAPPTTREPRHRTTTTITVHCTATSGWQLTEVPDGIAVEAMLAHGYHVGETHDGLRIIDQTGALAMTADDAVKVRVLAIPLLRQK